MHSNPLHLIIEPLNGVVPEEEGDFLSPHGTVIGKEKVGVQTFKENK